MFLNKFFTVDKIRIVYKLLHDLLLVLIIFFVLTLIAEGLLPGIISSRVGIYKIILAIAFNIFFINLVSKKAGATPSSFSAKKSSFVLIIILAALIFNGMRNIALPINILVLFLALISGYLFYLLFFKSPASS